MTSPSTFVPLGATMGTRQKRLLLATLLSAMFLTGLDAQIVATATPRILADLGGFSLLSWVFSIYMLTSVIAIPLAGKLSDIYGRKPFMLAGIVLFVSSSAGIGMSVSMPMLISFRALQGIGSGMLLACILAMLADMFTPRERGKYMALFIATGSIAQISGPTIGGFMADTAGWRWCFLINIPIASFAFAMVATFMPRNRREGLKPRIDFPGAALLSVASMTLLLALVWAQADYGWGSAQTVGLFLLSLVAWVLFVLQEARHPEPIMPLHLFRNREYVLGNTIFALVGAAQNGAATYLPTFVQAALGATATASGLITTPQAIGAIVSSTIAGQLMARKGRYRVQLLIALTLLFGVTLLLQSMGVGEAEWHISAYMVLFGLGSGVATTTMSVVILNSVRNEEMGVASSGRQFFQQIAIVLSIAVFGVLLSNTYHSSFSNKLPADVRAGLPATVVARFDDPTFPLDAKRFGEAKQEAAATANGTALLDRAVGTAHSGIAAGTRNIFRAATLLVLLALLAGVLLQERPLRTSFSSDDEDKAAAAKEVEGLVPEPAFG